MAISFVAAGTSVTGANPTVGLPAGITAGDLLLIFTTGTATPLTPTGWTQLVSQGSGRFLTVLYKYAGDSETNVSLSLTGTTSRSVMTAYRGTGGFDIAGNINAATSTAMNTLSQTTRFTNDYVISYYASSGGTANFTAPVSTTSRVNNSTSSTINGALIVDELKSTAGATTARTATQSSSRAYASLTISLREPQTLYWVGGGGSWDPTSTANWAATSGGAIVSGNRLATIGGLDSVIFNGSSGSGSIDISAGALTVVNFNATGSAFTFTGSYPINVKNGNFTLGTSVSFLSYGGLTFTGNVTASFNTNTVEGPITVVSGTTTLGTALEIAGGYTFTLTSGTLDLNGYDLICNQFSSSNTNTRSIVFGSNYIKLNPIYAQTAVGMSDLTNFSYSGTGEFIFNGMSGYCIYDVGSVAGGSASTALSISFNPLSLVNGSLETVTNSWFNNVDYSYFYGSIQTNDYYIAGSLNMGTYMYYENLPGTLKFVATTPGKTITWGGTYNFNNIQFDGVGGTWAFQDQLFCNTNVELTNGQIDLNGFNLITYTFSSNNSNTRGITFGGNSIYIVSSDSATVIDIADATNFTCSGSGGFNLAPYSPDSVGQFVAIGSTAGGSVAGAPSLTINDVNYFSTYSVDVSSSWLNDLTFTSFGGTFYFNQMTIAGSLNSISVTGWVPGDTITFAATSTGKTIDVPYTPAQNFVFDGVGGEWTLGPNPIYLPGSLTISNGTLIGIPDIQVDTNLTIGSGATISYTGILTLTGATTGTANITSSGKTLDNLVIGVSYASASTFVLQDALSVTKSITHLVANLNLNGFDATCGSFLCSGNLVRSISFGSNFINCTGFDGSMVSLSNINNFSNTGTGGFKLYPTSADTYTEIGTASSTIYGPNAPNLWVTGTLPSPDAFSLPGVTQVKTLNFTGFTGEYYLANQIRVWGSLILSPTMTIYDTFSNSGIEFRSTNAGNVIACAGQYINFVTFNGVGGTWTFQDAFNVKQAIFVTAGTINANNQNVTTNRITLNAGTLNMGSGTWNIGTTYATQPTLWSMVGGTVNSDTSTINFVDGYLNGSAYEFSGQDRIYYNLNIAGSPLSSGYPPRVTITGSNTFNVVSSSATTPVVMVLQAGGTQTVNNWTIDGTSAATPCGITSNVPGAQATISKASGTVTVNYGVIRDSNATGGATFNAGTYSIDNGNNTGWNFPNPGARYWVGGTTWNTDPGTKWSLTSGGAGGASVPGLNNNVVFDSSSGSSTIELPNDNNAVYIQSAKDFTTTGFTGSFSSATSGSLYVYGNFLLSSSVSGSVFKNYVTIGASSGPTTQELTTSGKELLDLNCFVGGSPSTSVLTLQDNLSVTNTFQVSGGTFNANDKNITARNIGATAPCTVNMGSGTFTCTNNTFNNSGGTINAGTSTIVFSGNTTGFFTGSAQTYNNVSITGNPTTVNFLSNNTVFNKISGNPSPTAIVTYAFNNTTTVTNFDIRGNAFYEAIVKNYTANTNAVLNSATGAVQSGLDYLSFTRITAGPTSATGATPYVWYVGSNSYKDVNSSGLIFSSDTTNKYYNLLSGTTWAVPADWNSSDNNVYLFGGGGGACGTVVASSTGTKLAGSGGGGGGFTNLLNATLTPGGSVSYTIGSAGAGGNGSTSSSTGASGGTTTFNVSNTAGGGGGAVNTLSATTVGAGGVGTTNNGGAGGSGGGPKSNLSWAGAGGGGSAGPDGVGGAGGNSTATVAGIGGNGNGGSFATPIFGQGGNGSAAGVGLAGQGYGAGGGGSAITRNSATTRLGLTGTQGAILIRYRPGSVSTSNSNFLVFF